MSIKEDLQKIAKGWHDQSIDLEQRAENLREVKDSDEAFHSIITLSSESNTYAVCAYELSKYIKDNL